jgi:hypothetical protein
LLPELEEFAIDVFQADAQMLERAHGLRRGPFRIGSFEGKPDEERDWHTENEQYQQDDSIHYRLLPVDADSAVGESKCIHPNLTQGCSAEKNERARGAEPSTCIPAR